ncbi:uncharacterized protein F5891DRAFT_1193568 [Suillus fuscotomentosus]|uniref:Uncharacterized protein n=1 Tax=Suillus fuscotomentosus TaxID=1912939 RepID=A0AAD4HHR8_9AGAM|nr:uncharacterized protein F5891DRAFT_1193568 [Suillus fuscotomentosus]KAG1895949.1 hypothetical protein F5891DRAFT_1193568 [Suillus fuscotomentosus]
MIGGHMSLGPFFRSASSSMTTSSSCASYRASSSMLGTCANFSRVHILLGSSFLSSLSTNSGRTTGFKGSAILNSRPSGTVGLGGSIGLGCLGVGSSLEVFGSCDLDADTIKHFGLFACALFLGSVYRQLSDSSDSLVESSDSGSIHLTKGISPGNINLPLLPLTNLPLNGLSG